MKQISTVLLSSLLLPFNSLAQEPLKEGVTPKYWNGCYAGLNVGVVKHAMNVTDIQATTFDASIQETSNPQLSGGLQVGYRRPLTLKETTGLYGLEFSTNFSAATYNQVYGSPYALYELAAENELKNIYLLQLIGGIAADRALLFFAVGLSWANLSGGMTTLNSVPYFTSFNADKQAFGTAIGGGVEYAMTQSLSARLKLDVITPNAYQVVDNLGNSFQISNAIVQGVIGINYNFG